MIIDDEDDDDDDDGDGDGDDDDDDDHDDDDDGDGDGDADDDDGDGDDDGDDDDDDDDVLPDLQTCRLPCTWIQTANQLSLYFRWIFSGFGADSILSQYLHITHPEKLWKTRKMAWQFKMSSTIFCPELVATWQFGNMDVSKNRGKTPKMDGFIMENPYWNGWFGGKTPIFGNIPFRFYLLDM